MSGYNMESFISDFAKRTKDNLTIINYLKSKNFTYEDPNDNEKKSVFEVTQLINSFLGLIILPHATFKDWLDRGNKKRLEKNQDIGKIVNKVQTVWEHCRDDGRYVNSFEDPEDIFRFCDHIRNSVAHNGVRFNPLVPGREIEEIFFYVCSKGKDKEFCLKLSTKNDKKLCSKLNIEEDNEVHILAGLIAELYKHIETELYKNIKILEGQNTEYEEWIIKLNTLLLKPETSKNDGTVAKQMEIFKKKQKKQKKNQNRPN